MKIDVQQLKIILLLILLIAVTIVPLIAIIVNAVKKWLKLKGIWAIFATFIISLIVSLLAYLFLHIVLWKCLILAIFLTACASGEYDTVKLLIENVFKIIAALAQLKK